MLREDDRNELRRAVVVTARFPWPPITGDRIRAAHWIRALSGGGWHVTLVAPAGSPVPKDVEHLVLRRSVQSTATNVLQLVRRGLPLHYAIASGYHWRRATSELQRMGRFDAAVVVLTRPAAWVDARAIADAAILDAVDALSASMRERAACSGPFTRAFWMRDAARTERHERGLATMFDAIAVISPDEAGAFNEAAAIPLAIDVGPLDPGRPRPVDFGFWGRLPYFANEDAVRVLLGDVWPRIRARLPGATLVIGGAEAPERLRSHDGRDGVRVVSPMEDRAGLLRDVKIALLPVRFGTGQSTKVLEAAEAGCAMVATRRALRGQPELPDDAVVVAETPESIADAACALRGDGERRSAMTSSARAWVESHGDMERMLVAMRSLAERAVSRSRATPRTIAR